MKIHLDDVSWPEVENMLKKPHVLLIPVGSVEQHGPHLPLSVDSRCANYMAEQAAEKVIAEYQIVAAVAPTINYTGVETFASFPGSIGVSVDTEIRVIGDIVRSCIKQGFRNIILINVHYPNMSSINTALRQVSIDYPEAGLYAVNWFSLGFEIMPNILKSSSPAMHADEIESSVSLVIQPENVNLNKAVKEFPSFSLSDKWLAPNRVFYHSRMKFPKFGTHFGVMGDPTVATQETGEKIVKAVVDDLVEIIVEVVKSEGK